MQMELPRTAAVDFQDTRLLSLDSAALTKGTCLKDSRFVLRNKPTDSITAKATAHALAKSARYIMPMKSTTPAATPKEAKSTRRLWPNEQRNGAASRSRHPPPTPAKAHETTIASTPACTKEAIGAHDPNSSAMSARTMVPLRVENALESRHPARSIPAKDNKNTAWHNTAKTTSETAPGRKAGVTRWVKSQAR